VTVTEPPLAAPLLSIVLQSEVVVAVAATKGPVKDCVQALVPLTLNESVKDLLFSIEGALFMKIFSALLIGLVAELNENCRAVFAVADVRAR